MNGSKNQSPVLAYGEYREELGVEIFLRLHSEIGRESGASNAAFHS
jgi:hypothetical protein